MNHFTCARCGRESYRITWHCGGCEAHNKLDRPRCTDCGTKRAKMRTHEEVMA